MTEFDWRTEAGLRIYAVDWPVERAVAVVGLVHGLGEHCRRYDHVARHLNAARIAVVGYDRQGFGRSEGPRGHAAGYGLYLDGVAELRVQLQRRYPGLPAFLYGQSMGGQLVLHYLIERKPRLSGAIVSSPHIAEAFRPNALVVAAGRLLRRIRPEVTFRNQLDARKLSRDPLVVEAYRRDELNHDRISAQTGTDLLDRAVSLQTYAGGLPVPTLLLHGMEDAITSHAASEAFAARNPARLTFVSYPDAYHELHNEPGQEEVMQQIIDWLSEILE